MKNLIILSIFLFLCISATAQNLIRGKVIGNDSLPLHGASVFIPDANRGTMTDKEGIYEFRNLPIGGIKIQFSFVGYANKIESIELKTGLNILNVRLEGTVLETEKIVVSGGYHSSQHENAVKIDVLKLNPLENKATPNIVEILTAIPGVDMISKGSGVSKPVIRGLSMNDILILNNGVRYENYQYSSHHPLGIDESGIEDVEVIKGPASLLYGSDAIGGVINFIKEKPAAQNSIEGDYKVQLFSNSKGICQDLGIKAASRHMFAGVRGAFQSNADYLQGGGDFVPNSRSREYSVKTQTGYTGKNGTFKLYFDHNSQDLGLVEEEAIQLIQKRGRTPEIYYQKINTNLLSSQNKLYLGRLRMDLNAAYQTTELAHIGTAASDVETQMKLRTLTYESKLHLPSDSKSDYILGFQGMNQQNRNLNNRPIKLLPDADIDNYSAFALLQHSLLKKFKLQTGIRYDYRTISSNSIGNTQDSSSYRPAVNHSYSSFSGSLGATYLLPHNVLLRANIASAFRAPNLAELTSNGKHETRYEIGNASLVPEKSLEGDISLHYHGENFTMDLAGYYNIINNYLFIAPTGDTTVAGVSIYKYQQRDARLLGAEAGIHYHPSAVKWLHFQTTFSTVTGKQHSGPYLPFIPAKKINLECRAERSDMLFFKSAYFSLNAHIAFPQRKVAPDESTTSGYTIFDLSTGGKIKMHGEDWIITISATNVFDTKYIDHLSTLKEVNRFNPGRNLALTLKIPFYHHIKAGG